MIAINNTTKQKINFKITRALAERFLRAHKKSDWEVSLAIVETSVMRSFNRRYRGINKTTDVLSFAPGVKEKKIPVREKERSKQYLGEIIINIAETQKTNRYREVLEEKNGRTDRKPIHSDDVFYFLLIHGLLHLIGYSDETEKGRREMIRLGREFLNQEKML